MEFPISFPFELGAPPLVELEDLAGGDVAGARLTYERRVSACLRGLELLLGQFDDDGASASRRAPRLRAVACGLLDAVQDVGGASWQLYTERWVDTAVGGQLDGIGAVIGQERAGRTDIVFRAFLRARVLANRSAGKWPELVAILVAMGVELSTVSGEPDYPAAWIVRLSDAPDGFTGADAAVLLEDAKAGAVRLLVEFATGASAEAFTYRAGTPALETDAALGYSSAADDTTGGELASVRASDPRR